MYRALRMILGLPAVVLVAVGMLACKPIEPKDADAFARVAAPRLLAHLVAQYPQETLPPEQHVRAFFRRIALADAAVVAEATSIGNSLIGPGGEDLGIRAVQFSTRKVLLGRSLSGWTSKLATTEHCAVEVPAQGTQAFTLLVRDRADVDLMPGLPPPFFVVTHQNIELWGLQVPVRALRRIIAAARKEVAP